MQLFNDYADKLLNHSILSIKNKKYRICEIEMYYHCKNHLDEYCHKNSLQLEFNQFYPHQFKNGTYKVGTYKCMDIVFGDKNTNTYFGILIRSMLNIDTNEFFTGPCICVKEILSNFACIEWNQFFDKYTLNEFRLIGKNLNKEQIYVGPRVGLSEKYPEFKDRKYRYAIIINKIKKQKIFEQLAQV